VSWHSKNSRRLNCWMPRINASGADSVQGAVASSTPPPEEQLLIGRLVHLAVLHELPEARPHSLVLQEAGDDHGPVRLEDDLQLRPLLVDRVVGQAVLPQQLRRLPRA